MLDGNPVVSISDAVWVLARYYRNIECFDEQETYERLSYYVKKHVESYDQDKWDSTLRSCSKNGSKHNLIDFGYIGITEAELGQITTLHNDVLERLLFAMLAIAKYNNACKSENDNWVNLSWQEIFKIARVQKSQQDRAHLLHKIYKSGFIRRSKKVNGLNVKVLITDYSVEPMMKITDFRELGYEYMAWKYRGSYVRCSECGILVKQSKNGARKYCDKCKAPKQSKTINCVDCGKSFETSSKSNKQKRCVECQSVYVKEYDRCRKNT